MSQRSLFLVGLVALVAGCSSSRDLRLYPVTGPIAEGTPAQTISVTLDQQTPTSGNIAFRLPPDRMRCNGTWTSVAPKIISHERGLSLTLRDTGGKISNSTKDVGGINSGEIYAVCTDGTRVQGRFITGSGTQSGTGTVTDTRGNSYKLLF